MDSRRVLLLAVLALHCPITDATYMIRSPAINGGISCFGCTFLAAVIEQYSEVHGLSEKEAFPSVCQLLPTEVQGMCHRLAHFLEEAIEDLLRHKLTPDVICYTLRFCHVDPGKHMCHLFPKPKEGLAQSVEYYQLRIQDKLPKWYFEQEKFSPCDLPGIKEFCKWMKGITQQLKPAFDQDGDLFSVYPTYRGSTWRGKDCDDVDPEIHPGRIPIDGDREVDSNCNGIYGMNPKTGNPFEEELCSGSETNGLVIIGDSIGAHFHFPKQWITATEIKKELYKNLTFVLTNEGDWPQLSLFTGYENNTWPIVNGSTDSLYLRMRERNLCMHRDFQNIAQNGDTAGGYAKYLPLISRNRTSDKPLLIIHAMQGNDVCNGFPDTLDHTTPPADYRRSILQTLLYLDEVVPKGSHVILMALINGSVLWDASAKYYHPLGELHHDVTMPDFFHWADCMEMTPCAGWQNSNATLRALLTKKADELSAILKEITVKYKFASFEMHYIDNPADTVLINWVKEGGQLHELIEPVDGLHPNQIAHELTAKVLYEEILKCCPEALGSENPNNELIRSLFGDQGGY